MQLQPGTLLQGRYRVGALIAQGGMGAVYQATDERLGNTVALKQTLMADPQLRSAFEREARLLAGLHHPALPMVSDHFAEGGGQFLVMQFIPGEDLATLMRRRDGPFSLAELLPWAERLLDVLDYLHSRTPPVIHRDVKPQNLKLTARGEIILLDFGLAKGEPAGATAVSPSLFGYTPQYAPLEQIQGSGTDARSDLYALAATLYELLTGTAPADALTRAAAAVRGAPDPLRPAHELGPQLPPALSDLLGQALILNPALRPASAAEMLAALRAAASPDARPQALAATAVAPLPRSSSAGKTTVAAAQLPVPPPVFAQAQTHNQQRRGLAPARSALYVVVVGAVVALLLALLGFEFLAQRSTPVGVGTDDAATAIAAVSAGRADGELAGVVGTTRGSPLPLGTVVEIPGWQVQIVEQIRGDQAYERLRQANGNNFPPPEGSEYLMLRARVTSTSQVPEYPFGRGDLRVIGERDVAYDGFGAVPPRPILGDGADDVPPGATVEGWAAYVVGVEETILVATVGDLISGEARFVELTPGASLDPDPALEAIKRNNIGEDARQPAALGETATTDDWELTVVEGLRGEAAWQKIYEGNRFNDPPAQGMEYLAAYMRVRLIGPGDESAYISDLPFEAFQDGVQIQQQSVVAPEPRLQAMLFPGGSAEGWVVVQVPVGAANAHLTFLPGTFSYDPRNPNIRYFTIE